MESIFDLGIIGAGPAGYSAAIRAAQKGLRVVIFEKDCAGGTCLNKGCIPTKAILHCTDLFKSLKKAEKFGIMTGEISVDYEKIFNRKNDVVSKIQKSLTKLIQSYGITIVNEEAAISSPQNIKTVTANYNCKNIIIATGSKPAQLKGLECDEDYIVNSNRILEMSDLPKNILIIGSGAIGLEWARILGSLGKNVTVIELAQNLLPIADIDVSKRVERLFKKDKIKFFTNTKIENIANKTVTLSNGQVLTPDLILYATGREPIFPESEINLDKNGKFINVNENFQTNYQNIFAIGDINGKLQLAHSAVHQAIGVVDFITENKPIHFNAKNIPSVIYGTPEIAWIGETEQNLQEQNYKISNFPIAALGKAQADDEIDGFVKVIEKEGKIVGAHAVTPEAAAIIQQFAIMIDNNLSIEDALKTVFAHPTYSEAAFEALLGLENGSISLPPMQ